MADNERNSALHRHCEERSDEAIQTVSAVKIWIASLPPSLFELRRTGRSQWRRRRRVPVNRMKVIGLAGWSGAGKTTLLTRAIPLLTGQGLSVSVIKHAHHKFDVDTPGKDSWRHR